MKMVSNLESGVINVPGAHQLTLVGINWAGKPSDEEFARIDAIRRCMGRIEPWLEGDIVVEYVRREREREKKLNREVRTNDLLYRYAEGHGSTYDTASDRYRVSMAFPFSYRVAALSWSHHRIVWAAIGEPLYLLLEWLAKAEKAGWSPKDLRSKLAEAKRPEYHEPDIPGLVPPEIAKLDDWCFGRLAEVESLTAEEARQQLEGVQHVAAYLDALRVRAAKESITSQS